MNNNCYLIHCQDVCIASYKDLMSKTDCHSVVSQETHHQSQVLYRQLLYRTSHFIIIHRFIIINPIDTKSKLILLNLLDN